MYKKGSKDDAVIIGRLQRDHPVAVLMQPFVEPLIWNRQIRDRFKQQVGLGRAPKADGRLGRYRGAVGLIFAGRAMRVPRVAIGKDGVRDKVRTADGLMLEQGGDDPGSAQTGAV